MRITIIRTNMVDTITTTKTDPGAELRGTEEDLLELLDTYLARYPVMAPQDVYKLLYQGILGPEHLLAEPEAFAARLLAEYAAVPPSAFPPAGGKADEPLSEPVRPDGRLLRVNLRPFKARGGDPDRPLVACRAAAAARWGAQAELRAAWAAVASACQAGRWPHLGDVAAFSAWLDAHDYPAVHHSTQYREAYQPAYRLVSDAGRALIGEATP